MFLLELFCCKESSVKNRVTNTSYVYIYIFCIIDNTAASHLIKQNTEIILDNFILW